MDRDRPNTSISGPGLGPRPGPGLGPRIGPGSESGGVWDDPDDLLDQARDRLRAQDEQNKEGVRLARRLIVAFVLVLVMGVGFYVVLPEWGVRLPPIVPALSFLAILVGAVLTFMDRDPPRSTDPDGCDDGCAVGMCSGPRPLRMFREPDNNRRGDA